MGRFYSQWKITRSCFHCILILSLHLSVFSIGCWEDLSHIPFPPRQLEARFEVVALKVLIHILSDRTPGSRATPPLCCLSTKYRWHQVGWGCIIWPTRPTKPSWPSQTEIVSRQVSWIQRWINVHQYGCKNKVEEELSNLSFNGKQHYISYYLNQNTFVCTAVHDCVHTWHRCWIVLSSPCTAVPSAHLGVICEQCGLWWIRKTDLDLIIQIGGITRVERQVRLLAWLHPVFLLPSLRLPSLHQNYYNHHHHHSAQPLLPHTPFRPADPSPTSLTGHQ